MCLASMPKTSPLKVAAYDGAEALTQASLETRLRKRRAGAAANVLTSATGIPSTSTMGGVAA